VVSVLDAAGVGALGRVALHTGDRGLARQAAEIAQVMLDHGVPSVRAHAVWALALQAMGDGDPPGAHRRLSVLGEDERMSILPLFPMDATDDPLLVRIALEAEMVCGGDASLRPSAVRPSIPVCIRWPLPPPLTGCCAAASHTWPKRWNFREGPRRCAGLADHGAITLAMGDTQDAADDFSRALEVFARTGAAWTWAGFGGGHTLGCVAAWSRRGAQERLGG
jgi:hypothetical protein